MPEANLYQVFQQGYVKSARAHLQATVKVFVEAVRGGSRRLPVQAAPGSGKTVTTGLLAREALRVGGGSGDAAPSVTTW